MSTHSVLARICKLVVRIERPNPVRVAIDGLAGAGKTTFADALAVLVNSAGRPVIRASIDGFHRPRAERYRRGADSPVGFYEDSFDHEALHVTLLDPLGPRGDRRYRSKMFDWREDLPLRTAECEAPSDAILLFDGIFVQRPELDSAWDMRIFLDVPVEETLRRMIERDRVPHLTDEDVAHRFWTRYQPGQQLYVDAVHPKRRADIVVDFARPERAFIARSKTL